MTNDHARATAADLVVPRRDETIADLLRDAARDRPDKPFVMFPDHGDYRMSYADALAGAEGIARALHAREFAPGGRVAVYVPNSPAYVWAWLGTLTAAAVDVAVNPELRGDQLSYALNTARVDAVITDRTGVEALAALPALAHELVVFVLPDDVVAPPQSVETFAWGKWESPVQQPIAAHATALPNADPLGLASIRFTSGSTGFPKGVMMSQAHMLASARMFNHMTGLDRDGVLYSSFPVDHVLSSVTGILSTLCAEASMALARKFSASRYWDHVRTYGATVSHILDAPATILLSRPPSTDDRAHRCRVMYTAAGAFPDFEERFGVRIIPLFDMSELTVVAYYPPGVPRRPGSCGVSSSLFDISIVDDDDYPTPVGEEGEMVVRPRVPHVMMLGYFDAGDLTVERWQNLWFHTGDRGVLDADGYLYFKGRTGDRIRRRGVNVSAAEIEAAALKHPDVAEAAVIAVPAELVEDDIKLCVLPKDGRTIEPAAMVSHLSDAVPSYARPRYVEVRTEFPRTSTEKVRKSALRTEGDHGLTATTWDENVNGYLDERGDT